MRVLVTGSSGFIGRRLCQSLTNDGIEVIPYDLSAGQSLIDLNQLLHVGSTDVVIHLAAKSFVPESYRNPMDFYSNNIQSTINVLEYCRLGSSRIIYFSSYVYGHPKYLPIDEGHPISAFNPYADTKIICENIVHSYSKFFNIPGIIFRPFNVYGPNQSQVFLIPAIKEQVRTGKVSLKDPRPKRDYVYLSDVIDAISLGIQQINEGIEVYNLGTGVSYSVEQIVNYMQEAMKIKCVIEYANEYRQNEVMDTIANIDKAKKILNWNPKVSLYDGIIKLCEAQ